MRGGGQHAFQAFLWQALAGLNVGRGVFIHGSLALQAGERLHLADDFAAGGAGLEHLPEKALAGEAQGEPPLAAVGAFVGAGQEVAGNEVGEVPGQLLEGALAKGAAVRWPRAARRARKAGKIGVVIGAV